MQTTVAYFSNKIYLQCDSRYRLPQDSWMIMATAGRLCGPITGQREHVIPCWKNLRQVLAFLEFTRVTSGLELSNSNESKNLAKKALHFSGGSRLENPSARVRGRHIPVVVVANSKGNVDGVPSEERRMLDPLSHVPAQSFIRDGFPPSAIQFARQLSGTLRIPIRRVGQRGQARRQLELDVFIFQNARRSQQSNGARRKYWP